MRRVSAEILGQVCAKLVTKEHIVQSGILLPVNPVQRDRLHLTWLRRVPICVLVSKLLFFKYFRVFGMSDKYLIKMIKRSSKPDKTCPPGQGRYVWYGCRPCKLGKLNV